MLVCCFVLVIFAFLTNLYAATTCVEEIEEVSTAL